MVKLVVEEQKEYPTLPVDSMLLCKVESVEVRTVRGERGDWDKLEYKFKILQVLGTGPGGPHVSNFDALIGEYIYGNTPAKITDSQEQKTRLWAEAILNRPIELGWELDTDYFLNREVRCTTSQYEKRAVNPATGKKFVGHQVAGLMAVGGGAGVVPGGAPQAAPAAAPAGWGAPPQAASAAPAGDPWAAQAPPAPAGDPWAAPPQQPQAPVQQAPQQQYAPAAAHQPAYSEPQYQQPPQAAPAAPATEQDELEPGF